MDIGVVTSIEMNHKSVDSAKKGQEICIKIEPIPGESPKMYGRHFEATDIIVSKVRTRPSRRERFIGKHIFSKEQELSTEPFVYVTSSATAVTKKRQHTEIK